MGKTKTSVKKTAMEKQITKNLILVVALIVAVLGFSYLIFKTDILTPHINEVTASYISFNNSNRTDMLKINSLKKMSDKRGMGAFNFQSEKLKITGKKDSKYAVVLYPISDDFELANIKYYLTDGNKFKKSGTIDSLREDEFGGIIIDDGVIEKDLELTLKLWLSDNYSKKDKNISFEIQVRQR